MLHETAAWEKSNSPEIYRSPWQGIRVRAAFMQAAWLLQISICDWDVKKQRNPLPGVRGRHGQPSQHQECGVRG